MTKEEFYVLSRQQYPELSIPVMDKLIRFKEPFILVNDIPVRWEPFGSDWKVWYDFDNEPMPVIIKTPIPNLKFNSKTENVSAFGLSDAKILLNIEGGVAPYKVVLKVNGELFRTIENIPVSTSEYNCPILGLPPGEYYFTIYDSQNPPAYLPALDDWNAVSPPYVTLNGIVNPLGLQTTVSFEYGETISYGHIVQFGIVNGLVPINANLKLSAGSYNQTSILVPGTLYHYRIVASNANGIAYGEDVTFTTPSLLPLVKTLPASDIS